MFKNYSLIMLLSLIVNNLGDENLKKFLCIIIKPAKCTEDYSCTMKCQGQYQFSCGQKHCAKSKQFCKDFLKLSNLIERVKHLKRLDTVILNLKNEINKLTPCKIAITKNKSSTHPCLNIFGCNFIV